MTRSVQSKPGLPIGIQTFREIREEGHCYVDKTGYALKLNASGKHYFLSRPRRFGKSLFVDTLKDLFEGRRELFHGLDAYEGWDWSVRHPVLRLDFAAGAFDEPGGLRDNIAAQLEPFGTMVGGLRARPRLPDRFAAILTAMHSHTGKRVVVLVDEYDKPILDALDDPDTARANRSMLRGLYSAVKSCDAHVRFCFLTGVSKFSKESLFSGLNNLEDITLDPEFSSICGFTEEDLDRVFADWLNGLDRGLTREWYKGYSWGGNERIYNPFAVLLLLKRRAFQPWWFETGSPTFLVQTLVERGVPTPALDGMLATHDLLSAFDVDRISTEALLFQTGYLTLLGSDTENGRLFYRLGYPNREVRQCLNWALLDALVPDRSRQLRLSRELLRHLRLADLGGFERTLRSFLASIPHDWHRRNPIASYEGYFASVVYSLLTGLGLDARAEDTGSSGRLDLAVRTGGRIYLFELKMEDRAQSGAALAQLKLRGYADKYRHLGQPIFLVGVEFSSKTRNVARFQAEIA